MTRRSKPISYLITLEGIPCPNTLVCSVGSLITLRKYRMFYYFVELYPMFLYCWAIPILDHCLHTPYFSTILGNSQSQYIAELNPILTHCLGVSNFIILLRKTPAQYVAEIYWILTHCWGLPNINTLLSYTLLVHCRIMDDLVSDRRWNRSFRLECPRFSPNVHQQSDRECCLPSSANNHASPILSSPWVLIDRVCRRHSW